MSSSKYNFTSFFKTVTESFLNDVGLANNAKTIMGRGNSIILDLDGLRNFLVRIGAAAPLGDEDSLADYEKANRALFFDLLRYSDEEFQPINADDSARRDKFLSRKKSEIAIAEKTFGLSAPYFNTMISILRELQNYDDPNIDLSDEDREITSRINGFLKAVTQQMHRFMGEKIGVFDVGSDDTAGKVGYIADTDEAFKRDLEDFLNTKDDRPIISIVGTDPDLVDRLNWLARYNSLVIGVACASTTGMFINFIINTDDTQKKSSLIGRMLKVLPTAKAGDNIPALQTFIETFDILVDECNRAKSAEEEESNDETTEPEVPGEEGDDKEEETEEEAEARLSAEEKINFAALNNMYNESDDEPVEEVKSLLTSFDYGHMVFRPPTKNVKSRGKYEMERGRRVRRSDIYDTAQEMIDILPSYVSVVFKEGGLASDEMASLSYGSK